MERSRYFARNILIQQSRTTFDYPSIIKGSGGLVRKPVLSVTSSRVGTKIYFDRSEQTYLDNFNIQRRGKFSR